MPNNIGSNSTHENSPMNSPDFAVSPAGFSWPVRNRHTVACMLASIILSTQMTTLAGCLVYVRVKNHRDREDEDINLLTGHFQQF